MNSALLWFRRDLRLTDNPALLHALRQCDSIVPVYIHNPEDALGAASKWWLHHSLTALADSLRKLNSKLIIRIGEDEIELLKLARETGATDIFWNRRYEPERIEADSDTRLALQNAGLHTKSFNGALMFEPWEVAQGNGNSYRVFTPFWKRCTIIGYPAPPGPAPNHMPPVSDNLASEEPCSLNLVPKNPWHETINEYWTPGESGALELAKNFSHSGAANYLDGRNAPASAGTSGLSPHLHFGEISPLRIMDLLRQQSASGEIPNYEENAEAAMRQLSWRDFAHHLIYYHPNTVDKPLNESFDKFVWSQSHSSELRAWQKGQTGVPLVDAGMRELWHTGWMHNRVRMVVASFLCKNLMIPWQEGAAWFMDTLVDADLPNNTMGWQWVAGCGADAAPYFRVFNPVLQGQKFDPNGEYVKRWIPELLNLPAKFVHRPWELPELQRPANYPSPIVDLKVSRVRALEAYADMRAG